MRLVNKSSGEQYFVDLFEKWWHYPLLALTWFLPHKAYPYIEKDSSVPVKTKFDAKMGLATGFSFILGDIIRSMNLFTLTEEYYWIGKVFAYPLSLIALIITWRYFSNLLKKKDIINFEKYYYVRLRVFSFKAFKAYSIRLIFIYIAMLVVAETIKFDVFSMLIVLAVSLFFVVLLSLALGAGVGVTSIDGDKLKTE